MDKKYYCCVTHQELSPERVEALIFLGVAEENMTCLEIAQQVNRRRKAIELDDNTLICDSINDSIHLFTADRPPSEEEI